ncbi:MAG: translation elongation factor Ts [Phycisphaerae bacterium]|nr:translation elongation factor Ts [Phycisphaerae bacterium]
MAEISAAEVMKLRNRTGLSMMECKKALQEADGDPEKAEDLLRKKLKGKMDARTDRAAGAGRITVVLKDGDAAITEVRCETDFTALNDQFVAMCKAVTEMVCAGSPGAAPASAAMQAEVDKLRITTGENCSYARGQKLAGGPGVTFGVYVHHDGKTGALIKSEGAIPAEQLKQIGMHIVAAVPTPKGVSAADIPADVVDRERKFRIDQAMESGKPKEIAEKMVEGGMRKFFEEIALLEQPFVVDPTKKVKDLIGSSGKVLLFHRWAVGETA